MKSIYKEIDSNLQNKQNLILMRYLNKVNLIEEVIGCSYYLISVSNIVFLGELRKKCKELDGPTSSIQVLYQKNVHSLVASYKLAMQGLFSPSKVILRTVFEGITQIYLIHSGKKEAKLFYKSLANELSLAEEQNLRKTKFKELSPGYVRNILYEGEKKKELIKLYSALSEFTHPCLKSSAYDIELKDEVVNDTLGAILVLGSANLVAFNKIFSEKFDKKTIEVSNSLLGKVNVELGGGYDFVPNH